VRLQTSKHEPTTPREREREREREEIEIFEKRRRKWSVL
jgi:hypothetical protein